MASIEIGRTLDGVFLGRKNRFLASVLLEGKEYDCFLPNPGRLAELLYLGAPVLVLPAAAVGRRTRFDLVGARDGGVLVSIDSRAPNRLVREALLSGEMAPLSRYREVVREYAYRSSRVDFMLPGQPPCLVEAKSCTLVRSGVALFPDAPTRRGRRHLLDLSAALREGYRSAVVFLVQRADAKSFAANETTDPGFAQALRDGASAGVEVYAYRSIFEGTFLVLDKDIPVLLGRSTT